MRVVEDFAHPFPADVGVDLGRAEVRMTKEFLHRSEVGTTVEQVGCERVPQRVRMSRSR